MGFCRLAVHKESEDMVKVMMYVLGVVNVCAGLVSDECRVPSPKSQSHAIILPSDEVLSSNMVMGLFIQAWFAVKEGIGEEGIWIVLVVELLQSPSLTVNLTL